MYTPQYTYSIYSFTELYCFCLALSTRSCPTRLLLGAASWSYPITVQTSRQDLATNLQCTLYSRHIYSITNYLYCLCLALSMSSCPTRPLLDAASRSCPRMPLYIQVRFSSNFQFKMCTVYIYTVQYHRTTYTLVV